MGLVFACFVLDGLEERSKVRQEDMLAKYRTGEYQMEGMREAERERLNGTNSQNRSIIS